MISAAGASGVRVLVVEGDPIVRAGWRTVLAPEPWVAHCSSAAGAADAVRAMSAMHRDLALVGLFVGGTPGVEVCAQLVQRDPRLAVILVSDSESMPIGAARLAGARGLLHRSRPLAETIATVQRVARGETAFPVVAEQNAAAVARQLSSRERAVLRLVSHGASNSEIARELHLSPHTVKDYVRAVLRKLEVRNRAEAAMVASRLGYAD